MADWKDRLNLKKEALKDLEDALEALKKKIKPVNPKLFEAMSKDYLKNIERIKVEMGTMTIDDYIQLIDVHLPLDGREPDIKGFTIGRGKKVYWYVSPMKSGKYRCLAVEKGGKLGWPRFVNWDQMVKVVRKS